ncbi:metallophosphoesterase [Bacteroidota bacterium]
MQPYLQAVTDSSIIVMVESDSKKDVFVKFGKSNNLTNTAKTRFYVNTDNRKKTYVHRVVLNGLKANTQYHYKAIQDKFKSKIYKFQTAVKPGTAFRFAVMGDCRSNPKIHSIIAKEIRKRNPAFSIYLGDLCHDSKYYSWKKEFFTKEELNLSSSVPFFNAIGNHEGWKQNTKAFQQSPTNKKENNSYYSFNYGDILFLIINTEQNVKKGSGQYKLIEKVLRRSNKKWKIAAFHIPAYCAGGHGEYSSMIKMTKALFEPHNIDFIFAGHTHFYQHNLVNGIRHLVVGGGGAPLYSPEKEKYTVKSAKAYSYAIFDVQKDKIIMTVYDIYGKVIDSLTLKK